MARTFRRNKDGLTKTIYDPVQIEKYRRKAEYSEVGGVDVKKRAEDWNAKNDLTNIKGVGEVLTQKLVDAGYLKISDVANSTAGELNAKVEGLKITQARLIHESACEIIAAGAEPEYTDD